MSLLYLLSQYALQVSYAMRKSCSHEMGTSIVIILLHLR